MILYFLSKKKIHSLIALATFQVFNDHMCLEKGRYRTFLSLWRVLLDSVVRESQDREIK